MCSLCALRGLDQAISSQRVASGSGSAGVMGNSGGGGGGGGGSGAQRLALGQVILVKEILISMNFYLVK